MFDDPMYSALAEILLLNEAVPPALKPLWDHAAQCPDCLAILEEHRMWDQTLQSALATTARKSRSDQSEPAGSVNANRAFLVLAITLVAAAWQLRVRRRSAWIGQERSIETRAATRKGEAAATVVEFDGFAVEVIPGGESVQVTVFSSTFDVDRLLIRTLDAEGQCVDCQVTDNHGSASLIVPSTGHYDLTVEWPD